MPAANPDTIKLAKDVPGKAIFLSAARRPDSERVFLGGNDFKVYDLDLGQAKPEPKEVGAHGAYVTGVALAGPHLVSCGYDGRLVWWDVEARKEVRAVEGHKKWCRRVTASPDGKLVASVADDMVCRLWDAESGKPTLELRGHAEQTPHHFPSMLYAAAFAPDGRHLATVDKVGVLIVWEAATGKEVSRLDASAMYTWDPVQRRHSIGGPRSLAFSSDGALLAVGGIGKIGNIDHLDGKARVEVFDWQKKERTHEFADNKVNGLVNKLFFHPEGAWLLAAGGANDGFIFFLDLKTKKLLRNEKAGMHVHDAAMNEAFDTLYCAGHNRVQVFGMKA
jgi:WD40 repeat protein